MRITARTGFLAGLLLAIPVALWLWQLWTPARQVQLHSENLLAAIEAHDWEGIAEFVDEAYADQWEQDRALMLSRLEQVLRFARNLRISVEAPAVTATESDGEWSARITVDADANEVSELIKARVNALDRPFELRWQRKSEKPWDWKLVRVSNTALQLPEGNF
ncbi:MAG TPA: hypothetical protein VG095_04380 [Chthoniobacterales bacterium]|nr:hypothetical protein [Chthoniobacterales bacterium]